MIQAHDVKKNLRDDVKVLKHMLERRERFTIANKSLKELI